MDHLAPILERLLRLHPKEIDLSLDRMWRLLGKLDHPERALPPVVHVAGTNGKGSTVAFMRAMLEAEGHRVHVYTSPHLVRFNERIRLGAAGGGRLVADDALLEALRRAEAANGDDAITFFEITSAAALLLFAGEPADILLLEVGLGGRLDATNVVERPVASVITSVSLDHAKFLGDTIPLIAAEKAGILKRGVPAIVARQSDDALDVIERQAARLRAPLKVSGQDWTAMEERGRFVYQDEDGLLDLPLPRLAGRHQLENAGTAIAALRALDGFAPPDAAIETGLLSVAWPGRLQRLGPGPLTQLAPAGAEVWLDGGHNPDGGRVIAAAMAELEEKHPKPLVLVAAMLSSKDAGGFLNNFRGLAKTVLTVPIERSESGVAPADLAAAADELGFEARPCRNLASALETVPVADGEAPRILICGSLYLAGDVLAGNGTVPE